MPGQRIVLNIDTQAPAAAPRIDMTAADDIAVKIRALRHAVSARQLTAIPGGGVSGRCRKTGELLKMYGATPGNLNVSSIGGKPVLGGSGFCALGLPPGSLTPSYTNVVAAYFDAADISASTLVNLLSGFTQAEVYTAILARYYGTAASSNAGMLRSLPATTAAAASIGLTTAGWHIVTVDYNGATKTASIAIDQAVTFGTSVLATTFAPAPTDFLAIGYHLSSGSLQASKVGDLYTFDSSMLATDLGKSQLVALVAALKAEYGVA